MIYMQTCSFCDGRKVVPTMTNARFWIFVNDGPVQITLKPGQRLSWSEFHRHEEGWSSQSLSWEYDGRTITHEYDLDGADCDGRLSSGGVTICSLEDLLSGNELDGVTFPRWEHADSFQRDYAAESAGY